MVRISSHTVDKVVLGLIKAGIIFSTVACVYCVITG